MPDTWMEEQVVGDLRDRLTAAQQELDDVNKQIVEVVERHTDLQELAVKRARTVEELQFLVAVAEGRALMPIAAEVQAAGGAAIAFGRLRFECDTDPRAVISSMDALISAAVEVKTVQEQLIRGGSAAPAGPATDADPDDEWFEKPPPATPAPAPEPPSAPPSTWPAPPSTPPSAFGSRGAFDATPTPAPSILTDPLGADPARQS